MVDTSNAPSDNQSTGNQPSGEYQYDWQNPNLKKFDFGRMMSRSFRGAIYCGQRFWLPLILIFGIPYFLVNLWPMFLPDGVYGDLITGGDLDGLAEFFEDLNLTLLAFGYIIFLVFSLILYVAMSHNIFGFYNDQTSSFKESIARGLSRFWVTLAASILFMLGLALGMLLFIIPGIILLLGWYIMTPVIAVEDNGPVASLSRAWDLSKGSKRWVLLFFVVLMIVSAVLQALFALIALPFGDATTALLEGASNTYWIVNAIGATIAQIFIFLLTVAGLTSIYYEIRDVKEGVSQDKLSAVFD